MADRRETMRSWSIRGSTICLGQTTKIMGIVNLTPDSFSDGGQFPSASAAVDQALRLESEGADFLDLGGESSRPGAEPVSEAEELRRVIPVVEQLSGLARVPLSIDTTKSRVAHEALLAGAAIINDISGLRFDPHMSEVCRQHGAGIVCMHMRGTPQTMQLDPQYGDVVAEIREFFHKQGQSLVASGLSAEQIVWDPGIGFGKTANHNLEILGRIDAFRMWNRPVLIGHSRKRFLQKVLGRAVDERVFGTLGVSIAVAAQGADIIRVHDVAAHRDALFAFDTVMRHTANRDISPPWQSRQFAADDSAP